MMTDDDIKKYYSYNPETGVITRLERMNSRCRRMPGGVAGYTRCDGYLGVEIKGKEYLTHCLAWFLHAGAWPEKQIDHINGNKTDNRISNLREVGNSQNQHNTGMQSNNTSGFKGVSFNKRMGKYMAYFSVNNSRKYLGYFATAEEASEARNEYAKKVMSEEYAPLDPAFNGVTS